MQPTINGILIRNDGLTCTFQAPSWRRFAELAVKHADCLWGRDRGGVVKVFGADMDQGHLEEHSLKQLREMLEANTIAN